MAKATDARFDGKVVGIGEALALKAKAKPGLWKSFRFFCVECGDRVRPHKKGSTGQAAHFEHLRRNVRCPLSGPLG